jgi:hypothetical protein
MSEAPLASRDPALDRNVLLFRMFLADMTPPSLAIVQKIEQAVPSAVPGTRKPEGVSNSQNRGGDGRMNGCVGAAWRMFCSIDKKYRGRHCWSDGKLHVDGRQFHGKGSEGLRSQLKENIARLS